MSQQFPPGSLPPPPQRPPDTTNKLLGYLLGGLLIGPALAVVCPLVGLGIGSSFSTQANDYDGTPVAIGVVGGILVPLLVPIPFLTSRRTRPWGVGMLAGAALTMIVFGGLCAGFIYLLSQEG
jgi:hypothetical protein